MRKTLTFVAIMALFPWATQAQHASGSLGEPLDDLITASPEQHNPSWWAALEGRLVQEMDVPYDSVAEGTLQALVYFALNHAGKLDLDGTVPSLLDVYRYSAEEGKKILALRVLYAVGDAETMQKLAKEVERERPSKRVERMTRVALAEYRREQEEQQGVNR